MSVDICPKGQLPPLTLSKRGAGDHGEREGVGVGVGIGGGVGQNFSKQVAVGVGVGDGVGVADGLVPVGRLVAVGAARLTEREGVALTDGCAWLIPPPL